MHTRLKARSPAKLILSGEHAVVYGAPAMALAIDRYAYSTVLSVLSSSILFNCLNLHYARSLTRKTLKAISQRIQMQYRDFLEGRCGIRDVLKKPFELVQYTVMHILESLNISLLQGLEIQSDSTIPMGCGLGSSAAVVMSTLYAIAHFFGLEVDSHGFVSLGRAAENLQHGQSSGLDLQVALLGGCLHFEQGQVSVRAIPETPMMIVQTGTPLASTGECVRAVEPYFKTGSLLEDFSAITRAFDEALGLQARLPMQACIRENHRLLVNIGVVPLKVQDFIQALEKQGAAAKICGAGSIAGDQAGVVLVVADQDISETVMHYGYSMQPVCADTQGTCLV